MCAKKVDPMDDHYNDVSSDFSIDHKYKKRQKQEISQTKAVLVVPMVQDCQKSWHFDEDFRKEEITGLALALGFGHVDYFFIKLRQIRPSTFMGAGQIEELSAIIEANQADLVIVDDNLSPVQQRNLEQKLGSKVIDRTDLILEIFADRAQTHEGRLQVELASLTYQRSRLVKTWTHLERQRGGFGFTGGPGESQLEIDRRLIDDRIKKIKKKLEKVEKTRALHRKKRKKIPYPIVALVGYTNAGKSTLFNRMTASNVFAKDLLFATLDPTMRMVTLPSKTKILLSDTVGFISNLPTHLVSAFRATLEEVVEADVILHIRDISSDTRDVHDEEVDQVLDYLGVGDNDIPVIKVDNKIDLLDNETLHDVLSDDATLISAVTGENIDHLCHIIDHELTKNNQEHHVMIDLSNGAAAMSWLFDHAEILAQDFCGENDGIDNDGVGDADTDTDNSSDGDMGKDKSMTESEHALSQKMHMHIRISAKNWHVFIKKFGDILGLSRSKDGIDDPEVFDPMFFE